MKKNLIIGIICYVITGLLTILFLATSVSVKLIMPEFKKVIVLCVASIFTYFGGRFLTKYHNSKKYMKISIWVMFILYLLLLINFIVLGNNFGRNFDFIFTASKDIIKSYFDNNFNIIPFNTIKNYLDNSGIYFDIKLVCINLLGNLLCFMPFAFFLKYLFKRENKFINFLLTILLIVISFELIQLLTLSGSFDIDDIILNTLGAILFYLFINLKGIDKLLRNIFFLEKNKINGKDFVKPILALFTFILIISSIIFLFIKQSNDSNEKWNEIYNPLIEFSYDKTCGENNMFYEDELFEYYFDCYDKDKFYLIVNKEDKLLIKNFLDSSKYVYDIEKLTWKLKQNNIEYYTKHKNPNYILHLPKFEGDFGYKGVKNDYVNIVVKGVNTSIYDLDLNFIPLKEGKTTIDFKVTNEGKVYTYTFDITIDKDLNLKYELKN